MRTLLLLFFTVKLFAITIINKPIVFDEKRIDLTHDYIKTRYALDVDDISIIPQMVVVHWTASHNLNGCIERFKNPTLPSDRGNISKASSLNVSTHFMIDRDGTIYRLMDETLMARHVIGLNYSSIGIENVGGKHNKDDLTPAQLKANIELIAYLKNKYSTIEYLIGHHEYTDFTDHPLWLENDDRYRTIKYDPGDEFMDKLRQHFPELAGSTEEQR